MPPPSRALSQSIPPISFSKFSSVVLGSFHKDISLETTLIVLFSILENPSTFDHHSRHQFKRVNNENRTRNNGWISTFSRALIARCAQGEHDLLGIELHDKDAVASVTHAVDSLAVSMDFGTYNSRGKHIRTLLPLNWQSIDPVYLIIPTSVECETAETCQDYSLHVITRPRDVPQVTLIEGSRIHRHAYVVNGGCSKCKVTYSADHEMFPDAGTPGQNLRCYLNKARYLKIGQSLWCNRQFSNAVVMAFYSFHASPSAYTQFWNNSFAPGLSTAETDSGVSQDPFKLGRKQVWQAFVQESIRTIATSRNANLTLRDGLPIQDVTQGAFGVLGSQGIIQEAKLHSCDECTQPYKETSDVLPDSLRTGASDEIIENTTRSHGLSASDAVATQNSSPVGSGAAGIVELSAPSGRVVKMVVVDGIVTGTTHCAHPNCTHPLANHRGESFCWTHKQLWGNRCRVLDCQNSRIANSYACDAHQDLWRKYQQDHSRSHTAGMRRALHRPGDTDAAAWQRSGSTNTQRHDEPQDESAPRAHYFSPNRFYCVETICAPCGAVIAWAMFATSESPTKILGFLGRTYPDQQSRPFFICVDKACLILRTAANNKSWEEWKKTSRFIVDTYHYTNHKATDDLCRTWCNPAPANGSQPNLVVIAHNAEGQPYMKRAFNTQACEQLNAWLGGFDSILKRMVTSNFQWFLHVMLWYHTRFVIQKQATKHSRAGAELGGEDDIDVETGDDDSL